MPPIEIPETVGFSSKTFDIAEWQQVNPTGDSGFIQTLRRSSPTWFAEYETPGLTGAAYDDARVFFDQLEGSMNTFLAYDPRRIKPKAYIGQPFLSTQWGTAPRITAQDYANSTIDLDQVTAGALITKGDYISVKVGNIWYLFRSQESRTVGGTGVVDNLAVKPRPQIVSLVNTVLRYHKPCIEMKMLGGVEERDSVDSLPSFRFRAAQYTNRVPA